MGWASSGAISTASLIFQIRAKTATALQVLGRAVHQAAASAVFERLDAAAEGRLRKVNRQRRGDEAAVLVKGDEVAELAEIDMHFLHGKYRANAIAGDGVGFL